MRSEQEIIDLILSTAKADDRIRAVYMNGSRTNPNSPKDIYQDYDIVYIVTETDSFINDKKWIEIFGDISIVQEPDDNDCGWGLETDFSQHYTWLMLFKDGTRIDLSIEKNNELGIKRYSDDKLTIKMLDKDDFLPDIPEPTDEDYHIKSPTIEKYRGCCNEFFWCLNNVAKGIARDELPYVMEMYNIYVRQQLNNMVEWYIGIITNFSVSAGKMGKYYKNYLPYEYYEAYKSTYSDSNYENIWNSIFTACDLFRTLAIFVSKHFNFVYNKQDDENMIIYLKQVKNHEFK